MLIMLMPMTRIRKMTRRCGQGSLWELCFSKDYTMMPKYGKPGKPKVDSLDFQAASPIRYFIAATKYEIHRGRIARQH